MDAGQALNGFDWALVVGGAGALAFFLRRFVSTMDKLDEALKELRLTLAEDYVTKDDLREFKEEIREMLKTRFERIEALCPFERIEALCPTDECPAHGLVRKEPRT